jgi:hypothetical protein
MSRALSEQGEPNMIIIICTVARPTYPVAAALAVLSREDTQG